MTKIDVCLNVYGKPQQTLVTLLSLLRHSGAHVDRIYLIEEARQPEDYRFEPIAEGLEAAGVGADRLVRFRPRHHLWTEPTRLRRYHRDQDYAESLRYEYGIRQTDKRRILLIHNDVLFQGDVVGAMLAEDPDCFGVGEVGQCWNCPLHYDGLCSGEHLHERLGALRYREVMASVRRHPETRTYQARRWRIHPLRPLPMPECRINEWCMLVHVELYREEVLARRAVPPLGGYFCLDIGDAWFRGMVGQGHRFKHIPIRDYLTHAYFSEAGNGHTALFSADVYAREEARAKAYLAGELGG